ncbi:MAG: hypothetical protein GQ570_08145 [Helicobacteraceae bacterium]|nr:hypothetical protein [Helicobacteraceae bacterium]
MKKIFLFVVLFALFSTITYSILYYSKNEEIKSYLNSKTEEYLLDYNILYKEHKRLAEVVYVTKINTPQILEIFKNATNTNEKLKNEARVQLHKYLHNTYKLLKTFNIKQLHFHLRNNESFLRFHRPKKFGDNLTDIRATIKYVNKNKKPIDGFEEGRIYNGYRFVYPLFYEKEHIGSVEISFNTLALNSQFIKSHDVVSNFLILKSVVEQKVFDEEKSNYMHSPIKKYYLEKAMYKEIMELKNIKVTQPFSQTTIETIENLTKDSKSISLYDTKREQIITFIKVQNPISKKLVGLFVVSSSADFIYKQNKHFQYMFTILNILMAVVLFLLYKENNYKNFIEQSNRKLQASRKEILKFNETLTLKVSEEVEKNRKKDQQMLQHSRLAQMGEMISMIAHQWRQPLSAISATSIDMNMQIELKSYNLEKEDERDKFLKYMQNSLNGIDSFVSNLTTTIDDFRNFYKPNKVAEVVSITDPIRTALHIVKPILIASNIKVVENFDSHIDMKLHKNELVQVYLNLLKNAQDNFQEKDLNNAEIIIYTKDITDGVEIKVCDNGGGIEEELLEKIFDPYFSTKEDKNGTGLGLYMSKTIVEEHHNGALSVENLKDKNSLNSGVCFKVVLLNKEKNEN